MPLTRSETTLLAAFTALLGLALVGPFVAQPAGHHAFADARALAGLPFAMDVLSNLPFALAGLLGLAGLRRAPGLARAERGLAALFFGGLLATAAGSTWYHLQPDDAGLLVDRLGMAVAFAGLLGLAVACKVSERAGVAIGVAVLLLGPASAAAWAATGNVLPWAVVQFGGMAMVVALAALRDRPGVLPVRWAAVIGAYVLAKLFELGDHAVFDATGSWVSGHTLKHAIAALAAWPVIAAVAAFARRAECRAGKKV